MSDSEKPSTSSDDTPTNEVTKLVKILPKEAKSAHTSGSINAGEMHRSDGNRFDSSWQQRLYSASKKFFRDFDKSMPTVWFTIFELKLQQFELVTDEQRNSALTSCLPNDVLLIVHDLLINEPSYQTIKQRLIQWFEPNLSSRVSELLSYPTVAEERPSRFLLTLRTKLAQGDMSEDMIRELFIAKMPDHLRNSLIAMRTASLDELAITADKMVCNRKDSFSKHSLYSVNQKSESFSEDNVSFQIKSLENKLNNVLELVKGSNSFSTTKTTSYNQKPARGDRTNKWHSQATGNPQRQSQHGMCWYHLTFGDRARKCSPPCTFVVSGNEPRPLQQR